MADNTNTTVYAAAATTTSNNTSNSKQLAPHQSFDTGFPANANTLLQIVFNDLNGNHLANTPAYITGVVTATLNYNTSYGVYTVQLTPAVGTKKHQHDIAAANAFTAMKLPTKQVCLQVTRRDDKTIMLMNGQVLAVTGDLALLPAKGKSGCVCGVGLPPASGSDMEQFKVEKRCDTPKKK
jgi:hypothetical protein